MANNLQNSDLWYFLGGKHLIVDFHFHIEIEAKIAFFAKKKVKNIEISRFLLACKSWEWLF